MSPAKDPNLYRPNVGLALFHRDGQVFLGRRAGTDGPYQWQMPQGGVDMGESPMQAAYRELEEETGVEAAKVALLEQAPDWIYYDFPDHVRAELGARGRFLGQRQKWFAFRFLGADDDIKLDAHTPEFDDWRWGALASAPELVIPFKRAAYEHVARLFARYAAGE
jgi:putative (di)nucleoside polyphosphate hydrolase